MSNYAIIESGVVANIVIAESAGGDNWVVVDGVECGFGYAYDGKVFTPPESRLIEVAPERRLITNYAFLDRWTDDEAIAIDMASIDNPSGTLDSRKQSAFIRRKREKQAQARYADLDDPELINGVSLMIGMLNSMGIVADAAARIDEFLNAPILEKERYTGSV